MSRITIKTLDEKVSRVNELTPKYGFTAGSMRGLVAVVSSDASGYRVDLIDPVTFDQGGHISPRATAKETAMFLDGMISALVMRNGVSVPTVWP